MMMHGRLCAAFWIMLAVPSPSEFRKGMARCLLTWLACTACRKSTTALAYTAEGYGTSTRGKKSSYEELQTK